MSEHIAFTTTVGVGIADLQHAALAEARRIMREAKGDRTVAARLVLDKLKDHGWITGHEHDVLGRVHAIAASGTGQTKRTKAASAKRGKQDVTADYREVRRLYNGLLAKGGASPVALVLAAGVAGSYEVVDSADGTTVVYAKNTRSYQGVLGGAGAIIGGALGGAPGAAIGGAIGGVIGTIVDDCKD